jgi:hypothetical protein
MMMKDKAAIQFRRTRTGDVVGEIVSENGKVLHARNFGDLSDEELTRVIKVFQEEHPDVAVHAVRLTGN